jgi:hypothetical protein
MGNSISQNDREFIWTCLADFFSTAEVGQIPGLVRLGGFPRNDLRKIFFGEVAPACGHNLLITTPVVFEGFDPEWVKQEIERILARRDAGLTGKFSYCITFTFYKFLSGNVWREVEDALNRIPRK